MEILKLVEKGRGWQRYQTADGRVFEIARSDGEGPKGGNRTGWKIALFTYRGPVLNHDECVRLKVVEVFDRASDARKALYDALVDERVNRETSWFVAWRHYHDPEEARKEGDEGYEDEFASEREAREHAEDLGKHGKCVMYVQERERWHGQ